MRNLPEPPRNSDRSDLEKAIRRYQYRGKARGHNITESEINAVVALYDRYEAERGAPLSEFKGENLPVSLRNAIHSAYDKMQVGGMLRSVRDLLFKGVDLCPLCGIGPPVELDHHLPQSVFKPLAIHTRNLVPLCHTCNLAKLAGFSEDGDGFLHTYYDKLPDLDFLRATIDLVNEALMVSFAIDAAAVLPAGYCRRLTGQMHTLDLEARYQQEVNTYIVSHTAALHLVHSGTGQEGVRELLRIQTLTEIRAFHRNHWRPALLRALTDHDHFTSGGFANVLPLSQEKFNDLAG